MVNLADIHPHFSAVVEAAKAEIDAHAKAANDNRPKTLQLPEAAKGDLKERFQVTWFDDVDQSTEKEEILKGVLGAGDFSLFVAKPGTGKSVLVGDIGCHIAAGREWHGRKVKQGLVVFFAAERKKLTERRVAAWRKTHNVSGIPFVVVGGKLDLTSGAIDAKMLAALPSTIPGGKAIGARVPLTLMARLMCRSASRWLVLGHPRSSIWFARARMTGRKGR